MTDDPHTTTPSDEMPDDLVEQTPWVRADRISGQIRIIRDYAHVIAMAGASLDNDEGGAIDTLAFDIVERCREAISDLTDLQHMLHPHGEGDAVDADNGEVEKGEGDGR